MGFEEIDKQVVELYALVGDGFAGATEAFLRGDRMIAEELIVRDEAVDRLYLDIEAEVSAQIANHELSPLDITYLVGILRIVPELERSGDLVEHIAQKSLLALHAEMSPRLRGIVDKMGAIASEMWQRSANGFINKDRNVHRIVDNLDDEIDDLTIAFYAELASSCKEIVPAIELSLVGRYFERFADHSVNLARATANLPTTEDL
ncbi:MAG: phosphate signaling complex PhoU family protein [Acidimicrobiales bacterium]